MSLRVAARRLTLPGTAGSPSPVLRSTTTPTVQRRSKWKMPNPFKQKEPQNSRPAAAGPQAGASADLDDPAKRRSFLQSQAFGGSQDSIFQDEIDEAARKPDPGSGVGDGDPGAQPPAAARTRENTALVLDPDPRGRLRWQRRKVVQMVRAGGRASSAEQRVRRTERELVHKSAFMPTSVKKLVMLSRQIAGKPLDDAITQMRWSRKKLGREVLYYLEEARDLAVAQRGMGLGKVNGEALPQPRRIQTKQGKWMDVADPTSMYVAQSWVGRGEWRGKEIDYKGRGRSGIIQHPTTSITILLKEEKTRIREYEERQARKAARGPWVHLPNRPIYHQRPYYQW